MKPFTVSENRVIDIVETGGVANGTLQSQRVIHKIYDYIQLKITQYSRNKIKVNTEVEQGYDGEKEIKLATNSYIVDTYDIEIPVDITNKIQWLKKVYFLAKVEDFKERNEEIECYDPSGSSAPFSDPSIDIDHHFDRKGKKLNDSLIIMTVKAICGKVDKKSFNLVIHHELNHLYSTHQKLCKLNIDDDETLEDYKINYNKVREIYNKNDAGIGNRSTPLEKFCYITYRLFFNSEVNALVDSVYGDLKGLDSASYRDDIEKTQAHRVYCIIKEYQSELARLPIHEWEEFIPYVYKPLNSNITDIKLFRQNFLKYTTFKLRNLFNRMGKAASVWYAPKNFEKDKKREKEEKERRAKLDEEQNSFIKQKIAEGFTKDSARMMHFKQSGMLEEAKKMLGFF